MKKSNKKNKKLLKIYFRTVIISVFTLTILFWLVGKAVVLLAGERETGPSNIFYNEEIVDDTSDKNKNGNSDEDGGLLQAPSKTTFLILGVDKHELLTDVIMVGSFDRDSQVIDIISIPRDTYTEITSRERAKLNAAGVNMPNSLIMNAVHSYTAKEFGVEFVEEHIEDMLGIEIDYYAKINTQSFRELVDAVGGVEFDVPFRMYYEDPYQDLIINVPAGYYTLNGTQAEGLVRYRATYANGDLQRIPVQQDFMKAVFSKVLSLDTILSNPLDLIKVFVDNVETNFSVLDAPKYVPYISGLSPNKLNLYTMPYDESVLDATGQVVPDTTALAELTNLVFYSDRNVAEETAEEIYDKKIQVLNGSRTNGLAGDTTEKLKELGFNVVDFGNFNGDYRSETVIKVKPGTNASELEKLFDNAVIEYSGRSSDIYDVVIILGLDEEGIE